MCPCMSAIITVLMYFFKVLCCKIKNVLCVCLFVMCYLCEKYYKPITVQYYIVYCACWVPRLTLLDLQTGLETISLSCIWFLNIFSHSMAVHFLDYVPCSNKALNFNVVPFMYFCCFCSLCFLSHI